MSSSLSSNVQSSTTSLSPCKTSDVALAGVIPIESIDPAENAIQIIPIGIALPSALSSIGGNGIVGTIVIMGGRSAMVWISWGLLNTAEEKRSDVGQNPMFASFGKGTPNMGQLVVAMPRTNYKGAFATGLKEASCSQLVGSLSSEDQMMANQMASRLSTRSGMAIYVSCNLSSANTNGSGRPSPHGGGDSIPISSATELEMLSHHAAALAEKEIWKILKTHRQSNLT